MKILPLLFLSCSVGCLVPAQAEVRVTIERNGSDSAAGDGFVFKQVPRPSKNDAAAKATFTLVSGERDPNGGDLQKLNDGRVPSEDDQPTQNFFFSARGGGNGRILVDLANATDVKQINTYSRHVDVRAPQVYKVYGADGNEAGFKPQPAQGEDPTKSGWKLVASVDTRTKEGMAGGAYGVSVADTLGTVGKYRYLLFDIFRTKENDPFGQTFLSEVDVVDAKAPAPEPADLPVPPKVLTSADGKYHFALEFSNAPDLAEWTEKQLGAVILEWYPKLVELLASEGFNAPARVAFEYREDMGGTPAYAAGNRISLNLGWFRKNLQGEGRGAVVHEMVHVVQQYRGARRDSGAVRPPGWIIEGIPDYVRWFLYEPQSHGAEITKGNFEKARYDSSYRITGNFLNWLTEKYDPKFVVKLNAAARQGRYSDALWTELSGGKTVEQLGAEWKEYHRVRLGLGAPN